MVTILCLTYNHEAYIRQCLDGFIMQKTNFHFEAIVHDDASTDNTAAIVNEYAQLYPDIIKPIIENENQYSKHDGTIGRIMRENTRGKYVALCEGDDYWTDPYKLQLQVDFLENHSEYSMCFHNAVLYYENSQTENRCFAKLSNRDYNVSEIYKSFIVPTASVVYRRSVWQDDHFKRMSECKNLYYTDSPTWIVCGYCGKIRGFDRIMSVYRKHEAGAIQQFRFNLDKMCRHHIDVKKFVDKDLLSDVKWKIGQYASLAPLKYVQRRSSFSNSFQWWISGYREAPKETLLSTVILPITLTIMIVKRVCAGKKPRLI